MLATCPVTLLMALSLFKVVWLSVSIGSPALPSIASRSNTRAMDVKIASCVDRELDGYDVEQCSKNTSWYFSVEVTYINISADIISSYGV